MTTIEPIQNRNPRNAGRKPKGLIPANIRLSPEVIAELDRRASKSGKSRSDAAEEIMRSALSI